MTTTEAIGRIGSSGGTCKLLSIKYQRTYRHMSKKIANAPGWLALNEDRSAFIYLPDRAEVVREIFELSIKGLGGYSIAKLLNSRNVPAFGTSGRWDQSTIHNMLTSRATIGEFQKKKIIEGKEYLLGEPISGYYPPVIDRETFEAAQVARRKNLSSGRGRKGQFITNIFAGITTCAYCDSAVKFHRNGPSKSLICTKLLENQDCIRFAWRYVDFERSLLGFLADTHPIPKLIPLLRRLKDNSDNPTDETEIYNLRIQIAHALKSIVSTVTIAAAGVNPATTQSDQPIRRNHPARFFEVFFFDGSSCVGYPIAASKEVQPALDPDELSRSLGLSPRQAKLTALLAEGESLAKIAAGLSMTLSTARWHLREAFKRTNSHSQAELVNLAKRVCQTERFEDQNLYGKK
jgi:DNA-binding CsgD family transcriptional regulator